MVIQSGFKIKVTKESLKFCVQQPLVLDTFFIIIAGMTGVKYAEDRVEVDLADPCQLQEQVERMRAPTQSHQLQCAR